MKLKHLNSRKFSFAVIGTLAVIAVYISSLATMVLCPSIAPQVVNLANIAIVFLGSVTGVMVGGQSFVDWRHGSASQFSAATRVEEVRETVSYTEKQARPRDYEGEAEWL